jgi:hypothetical protein
LGIVKEQMIRLAIERGVRGADPLVIQEIMCNNDVFARRLWNNAHVHVPVHRIDDIFKIYLLHFENDYSKP